MTVLVGATVILDKADRMLLKQRISDVDGDGLWTMFGGKLEGSEWTIAGTARELHEEIGILIPDHQFADPLGWHDGVHPVVGRFTVLYSKAVLTDEQIANLRNCEPDKCAAMKWFLYEDLPVHRMWSHDLHAAAQAVGRLGKGRGLT